MTKIRAAFLLSLIVMLAAAGCVPSGTPLPPGAEGESDPWNLILNPYFALGLGSNGVPLHWEPFSGTDPENIELTTERSTVGVHSVRIVDNDPERSAGIRSRRIVAREGETFTLEVDVYVESGTAMVYLDFHDASGNRIVAASETKGVTSGWETVTLTRVAPAGTDHVSVILYLNLPNVGVSYFDNVRLYVNP